MPSSNISKNWTRKILANLIRSFLVMTILALGVPVGSAAQGFRFRGIVIEATGTDTIPLAGAWVSLHRVSGVDGSVRDSVLTDRRGTFSLWESEPDSSALYMAGVVHHDLAYFSSAVRAQEVNGPYGFTPLVVFDTASTGEDLRLQERHVVLRQPTVEGVRQIVELNVLVNPGHKTRVSGGMGQPVWKTLLPQDVSGFAPGPSDVSVDAYGLNGDTVEIYAPVPPGEENRREMIFGYNLPRNVKRFALPIDAPVSRIQILLEDLDAVLLQGPVSSLGVEQMGDGTQLLRFEGQDIPGDTVIVFRLSNVGHGQGPWALILVVGISALLMVVLLVRNRRRDIPEVLPAGQPPNTEVLETIAKLDREFAALGTSATARQRENYMHRRKALADLHAREMRRNTS